MFEQCFKRFSGFSLKKTELYRYVYDFLVDYERIDVADIWIFITSNNI